MTKIRVHASLEAAMQAPDGTDPQAVATAVRGAVLDALSGYDATVRITSAYVVPTEPTAPDPPEDTPPVVEPGDPVGLAEESLPS